MPTQLPLLLLGHSPPQTCCCKGHLSVTCHGHCEAGGTEMHTCVSIFTAQGLRETPWGNSLSLAWDVRVLLWF